MNYLAHGPSAVTIRCLELLRRQTGDRRAQFRGCRGDVGNPLLTLARRG
jgi:hypothetical protein